MSIGDIKKELLAAVQKQIDANRTALDAANQAYTAKQAELETGVKELQKLQVSLGAFQDVDQKLAELAKNIQGGLPDDPAPDQEVKAAEAEAAAVTIK